MIMQHGRLQKTAIAYNYRIFIFEPYQLYGVVTLIGNSCIIITGTCNAALPPSCHINFGFARLSIIYHTLSLPGCTDYIVLPGNNSAAIHRATVKFPGV